MAHRIEARLRELGITLPETAAPVGNYVPFVITGNLVFVAGHIPVEGGKIAFTGRVGVSATVAQAKAAARLCMLNLLAQAKVACGGDLDRLRQVVRLSGFTVADDRFNQHPEVINGASDVIVEILGDAGRHARTNITVGNLAYDALFELEGVFEITR
ncbi:MAG: RidA family protein [Alphaproteobacteria bacterium]|nr:RidA family protein [Alphaproteobacteria bacterium]